MSKVRVVVLEVTSGHLTVTAAARAYWLSRQHIYRLLKRYRLGGLDAVEPRSRRPASNPRAVPDNVVASVVLLREKLTAEGLDAGPLTLQTHLAHQGRPVPSTATIRRILHHHGLITSEPRKRPKSSYHRFQAAQPNQCWQSDFTHWQLANGSEVEILNWLDDHSQFLLTCTAYNRVVGPDVVASFTDTVNAYGLPASTLTDNGAVYTSRFTHGHNDFELLLHTLGVIGEKRPPRYNHRPHRALSAGTTPAQAYTALPKAAPPAMKLGEHFGVRHDTVDQFGKLTLRYASRLRHLGIGRAHAGTKVLILITTTTAAVITRPTHQLIASHTINPDRNYWPNTKQPPETPGLHKHKRNSSVNDDPTHA